MWATLKGEAILYVYMVMYDKDEVVFPFGNTVNC